MKTLVIFDLDGVLVDTLPMLETVYGRFLAQFGVAGSREEFSGLNGYTIREIAEYLQAVHDLPGSLEKLLGSYQKLIEGGMGDARLNPGARETLAFLKERGCLTGVASSARKPYIDAMLENHGIGQWIDFVVSGDDVRRAKPSTEIYEKACSRAEFDRCLIVEDSDNGIRAGQLADPRCRVVFYMGTQTFSLENYQYRIGDLRQLCRIVEQPEETLSFCRARSLSLEPGEDRRNLAWKEEAQSFWREARLTQPGLFNGKLFCLKGLIREGGERVRLQIYPSEYQYYKWALGQRKKGSFYPVVPLAVSGILLDAEGNTLFARRGRVTQYERRYELVPSGSLEYGLPVEESRIYEQLLKELEEELAGAVCRNDVLSMELLGLSCDIPDQVLDICVLIRLGCRLKDRGLAGNGEYEEGTFVVMPLERAQEMCAKGSDPAGEAPAEGPDPARLVPTSLDLLKNLTGR